MTDSEEDRGAAERRELLRRLGLVQEGGGPTPSGKGIQEAAGVILIGDHNTVMINVHLNEDRPAKPARRKDHRG